MGISWFGGKHPIARQQRSTVLSQWKSILSVKGVNYINLQYGDCKPELEEFYEQSGLVIHYYQEPDPLVNLDEFAAQIAALDLVISVDNANVHLAGAMGIPTWVLLPYVPDWRWFTGRADSPWYSSVKLFRQTDHDGDWKPIFRLVRQELKKIVSAMS